MIRLDVKEYCNCCTMFEPDVEMPTSLISSGNNVKIAVSDTIVRCKSAERCEEIKKYLERK